MYQLGLEVPKCQYFDPCLPTSPLLSHSFSIFPRSVYYSDWIPNTSLHFCTVLPLKFIHTSSIILPFFFFFKLSGIVYNFLYLASFLNIMLRRFNPVLCNSHKILFWRKCYYLFYFSGYLVCFQFYVIRINLLGLL